jgi:hypothetical protein
MVTRRDWWLGVALAIGLSACTTDQASSLTAPSTPIALQPACRPSATPSRRPVFDVTLYALENSSTVRLGSSPQSGTWVAQVSWLAAAADARVSVGSLDASVLSLLTSPVTVTDGVASEDLCWTGPPGQTFTVSVVATAFRAPSVTVHITATVP